VSKTPTVCFAESLNAAADNQNRIHNQTGADFRHDAAGNMTFDPVTGNSYAFDPENRITGAGGYTYTYDADGNRVEKSNGTTGTIYWYTILGIVAESDLNGNLTSEYAFFNGDRVARKDFPGNNVSYYFSDHLKTASVISDAAGNITEDEDFYPWGGEVQFVNNDPNHYKFSGKERDAETQLDYFGARYYGNWTGRFLTPDPLMASAGVSDPQTWNRYTYARNNPLKFIDPTGLKELTAAGCSQDNSCVTVKLNVVYDKSANDGKGLTNKQKEAFGKELQKVKDEYGTAHVHFDVTYSEGATTSSGTQTGLVKGSLNVVVSDSTPIGTAGVSQVTKSGYAITKIDITQADDETFSHEVAHHFSGDTAGWINRAIRADESGILGFVVDAFSNVAEDSERSAFGKENPFHTGLDTRPADLVNRQNGWNEGARNFQKAITPTQK
jgi:RHS repeat-associated protein